MSDGPFEAGVPVLIVNSSRLWMPPIDWDGKPRLRYRPIPIDMASYCFVGVAGLVERSWLEFPGHGLDYWRILVTLYGPRPETIISGMPGLPGVSSDKVAQLVAEPRALRRLGLVDAIGALGASDQ